MSRFDSSGILVTSIIVLFAPIARAATPATQPQTDTFRAQFLHFCDLAGADLQKPMAGFRIYEREYAEPSTHHMPAFEDAHAARALVVAYDLTHDRKYLDACRRWADWAVDCQSRMIPAGAYYMNHSRAPGEDHGQWNAADSGSVGMGVLATAMRCEGADRARYLHSVESFLTLIETRYVDPKGGICNGLWPEYAGPWWCSTGTVGKLAFLTYAATGDKKYLDMGLRSMKWLAGQDFRHLTPMTFEQRPSGTIFYVFDFYAAGIDRLPTDSPVRERVLSQFGQARDWLLAHQKTREPSTPDYTEKNVDMAGMPEVMYAFARQDPRYHDLMTQADRELTYIADLLSSHEPLNVSQLKYWEVLTWGMMSFAERLVPGSISAGRQP